MEVRIFWKNTISEDSSEGNPTLIEIGVFKLRFLYAGWKEAGQREPLIFLWDHENAEKPTANRSISSLHTGGVLATTEMEPSLG